MCSINLEELTKIKILEDAKSKKGISSYQQGVLKGRTDMLDELIKQMVKD